MAAEISRNGREIYNAPVSLHTYMYRNSKELNTIKYRVKTSRDITLNNYLCAYLDEGE